MHVGGGYSSQVCHGSEGKLRRFSSNFRLGGGAYELPVCQIPTLPPPSPLLGGGVRLDNDRRITAGLQLELRFVVFKCYYCNLFVVF